MASSPPYREKLTVVLRASFSSSAKERFSSSEPTPPAPPPTFPQAATATENIAARTNSVKALNFKINLPFFGSPRIRGHSTTSYEPANAASGIPQRLSDRQARCGYGVRRSTNQ